MNYKNKLLLSKLVEIGEGKHSIKPNFMSTKYNSMNTLNPSLSKSQFSTVSTTADPHKSLNTIVRKKEFDRIDREN
jgi:hypothetical protein